MFTAWLKRKIREQQFMLVQFFPLKESHMIASKKILFQISGSVPKVQKSFIAKSPCPRVSVRYGAVHRILSECQLCSEGDHHCTSCQTEPGGKFDVNVKSVEFALANSGYTTSIAKAEEALSRTRTMVHDFIAGNEPGCPARKDIAATCNGTNQNTEWCQLSILALD